MKYILFISVFLIIYHHAIYPLLMAAMAFKRPPNGDSADEDYSPSATLLIVVHNAAKLISAKIANSLALDYPTDKLEILLVSDGSDDATEEIAKSEFGDSVRVIGFERFEGKVKSINKAIPHARGEIIVFSDADAALAPEALRSLLAPFRDSGIGGVCGHKIIASGDNPLASPQTGHLACENLIRLGENRIGGIASNEGKLYAMRACLFTPIPLGSSDDLFNMLNVIRQRRQFIYNPRAHAYIPPPSKNSAHELERRRRIVNQSVRTLWSQRALLNPFRFGSYSAILASHKILRRLAPFLLFLIFASSLSLSFQSAPCAIFLALQTLAYALAPIAGSETFQRRAPVPRIIKKACSAWHYFCLGNLGTALGIMDIASGRKAEKWTPRK